MKLVVLVSGTGSNLRALADAIDGSRCGAHIAAVVSDKRSAKALSFATDRGIPTHVVPLRRGDDRDAWNRTLEQTVAGYDPELVVLAGFMRVLGEPLVRRFARRIVNVHPALLPSFPGVDAPSRAIAAGVRVSGCTVHLVDEGVDTGPILAQAAVPVLPTDDRDSLHERIRAQEHALLPAVVDWISRGILSLDPAPALHAEASADACLVSPRLVPPSGNEPQ